MEMTPLPTKKRKYLLIDDDTTYAAIMLRLAQMEGVDLEVASSLEELGSVGLLGKYDAVIVDYELEKMTGVEIAEYISSLFQNIPVVLVSARKRSPALHKWPQSIKRFVIKSDGYAVALREAIKISDRSGFGGRPPI